MSQECSPRWTVNETRPNQVSLEAQQQLPVDPVVPDIVIEDSNINDSSLEVWLSTPPLYEYISLVEWLKSNFDSYFKLEFAEFLTRDLQIITVQELGTFLESLNPKKILRVWGISKYDKWRQSLIDFKIIWTFIQRYSGVYAYGGAYGKALRLFGVQGQHVC